MAGISKRPSKSGMTYRIQVKIKDKGSEKNKRTIRSVLATAKKQRLIADNYASADYISFPKNWKRYSTEHNDPKVHRCGHFLLSFF